MTPDLNISTISPPREASVAVLGRKQNETNLSSINPTALTNRLTCRPVLQQPSASVDRMTRATIARATGGLSPAALAGAYWDWATHLGLSPGKQVQLLGKAASQWIRLARHALQCATLEDETIDPCIEPLPQDKRFAHQAWQRWSYNIFYQGFILAKKRASRPRNR